MKKVFFAALEAQKRGESCILMTILQSVGSTPRGVGANMLVFDDGTFTGTIGGGSAEFHAIEKAKEILTTRVSCTAEYVMTPNDAADIGMVCGGTAAVLFQYIDKTDGKMLRVLTTLCKAIEQDEDVWLCRRLCEGIVTDACIAMQNELLEGAGMDAQALLSVLPERAGTVNLHGDIWFFEPVARQGRVYLFGGGHVSQALSPLLHQLDFRVTVCEDRPEFLTETLFPEAEERVLAPFSEMSGHVQLRSRDFVVIMTRGHQADYTILRQALQTDVGYIGCIGSKNKVEVTRRRLLEEGFTDTQFARVHTPIGLPIAAETPMEIAVSIAAEMIRCRAIGV